MRGRLIRVAATALIVPSALGAQVGGRAAAGVVGTVEVHGLAARWPAVVYVVAERRGDTAAAGVAVMHQRGLRFQPSVLAIPAGAAVIFRNDDPLVHSVFSPGGVVDTAGAARGRFDLGRFFPGGEGRHTFGEPGAVLVLCHLHPEMAAYVVVAPTRAVTVTDAAGRFSLSGLVAGPTTIRIWHPERPPKTVRLDLEAGRTVALNARL